MARSVARSGRAVRRPGSPRRRIGVGLLVAVAMFSGSCGGTGGSTGYLYPRVGTGGGCL